MKEIELNHIDINGINYPIYCDLNVLEMAQNEYGSINAFERDFRGLIVKRDDNGQPLRDENGNILHEIGEPKIKGVAFALYLMILEGQRIEKRQTGVETEKITPDEVRELCDKSIFELSEILKSEYDRCFGVKKKLSPTGKRGGKRKNPL